MILVSAYFKSLGADFVFDLKIPEDISLIEQTKEFVEGNVDDIAYQLLDKFVNMGIRTNKMTFTADLALVIDAIRGLVYRDFNKPHPAQKLTDKMVTLNASGKNKSARLDYSKVLDIKHRPHKPLSRDVEDEVRDLSDMADIQFTPDFDPENKWIQIIRLL